MEDKKKYKQGPKYDKAPTIKPINSNKKKNFFSKENLIIIMLLVSISHNFYLQILTSETSDYARRAMNNASNAYSTASDASSNASAAYSAASDASSYASDASDYARRAMNYASEASDNAFANQCLYCPDY